MSKNIFQRDIKDIFKTDIDAKNILIIVVIGLSIGVYGYFGIYPKYMEYKKTQDNISIAQNKLMDYQEKIIQMPILEDELARVSSELDVKSKNLLHDMEDGMFLIGLDKKMKQYNVKLLSYEIEEPKFYESFYAVPTNISLRGDYRSVREIMYYLEEQKNITQILDYNMDTYIDKDKINSQSGNLNNNIVLTPDTIVYWNQGSSIYHLDSECSLIEKDKLLLKDKLNDKSIESICSICRNKLSTTEVIKEETPKATGVIEATFKFIMYTKENPTMELDTDNPNSWKPGKYNPFAQTR